MSNYWAVIVNKDNKVEVVHQSTESDNNYRKFIDAKNAAIYFLRQQMRRCSKNIKNLQSLTAYDCQLISQNHKMQGE